MEQMEEERFERTTSTTGSGMVQCPYWRAHSAHEVHCEGPIEGSSYIIRFMRKCDRQLHERIFCRARYQNCETCRILEEKHDWEDDDT